MLKADHKTPVLTQSTKSGAGFSTLEMLIAMALAFLFIPAILLVSFGSQSLAVDSQTNTEALHKAQEILDNALETSRNDFDSVVDSYGTWNNGIPYATSTKISLATECSKQITSSVAWKEDHNRPATITLTSLLTNVPLAIAMGGDCSLTPPGGPGDGLAPTGTPVNLGGNKTKGLDVLNGKVYVALQDNVGFVSIDAADPNNLICFGYNGGGCNSYTNGFTSGAEVYDIDVAKASNGRTYAYLARKSTALQFEVVDVTDIDKPVSIVKKFLNGITPPGAANSEGYRVYYYKGKLYITTRETAGKEFHVFNVATPWDGTSITEYPNPKELNRTVTDFAVVEQTISGTTYTIAYLTAKAGLKEISAWNATEPTSMSEIPASVVNLSGSADTLSLYFNRVNKLLYVGRQSNSAEELFVYNASNPFNGLDEKGKAEVGVSVVGIRVAGNYAYLVSDSSNNDLTVFNANPSSLAQIIINNDNNSNKGTGIDYEEHMIYESFELGSKSIRLFYVP